MLQSNLEYSNSNYASTSVFNKDYVWLRMESEDLFDKRNQGDLLGYETTRVLTVSGLVVHVRAVQWSPLQLGSTLPQCP